MAGIDPNLPAASKSILADAILDGLAEKRTIRTAPDALVFINRSLQIPVCRKCQRQSDFTNDVADISVNLSVDAVPGSASVTLQVPAHSSRQYFVNGRPVFEPMQEINIYFKGRYLLEGRPVYYQAFWGLVQNVAVQYRDGQHTIELSCADILRWWELTTANTNPTVLNAVYNSATQPSPYLNIFHGLNPYEIILSLALFIQGDLVHMVGIWDKTLTGVGVGVKQGFSHVMEYWRDRFKTTTAALRIFGMSGAVLFNERDIAKILSFVGTRGVDSRLELFNLLRQIKNPRMDSDVFRDFFPFDALGHLELEGSGLEPKLEVARRVRDFINYEFFMDTTGDIVFKPPFYNMDTRKAETYIIRDEDIDSFTIEANEQEAVTRVDVQGNISTWLQNGNGIKPVGYFMDQRLALNFGLRQVERPALWVNHPNQAVLYAMNELSRLNSFIQTASMTITGRPELRLGYPVWVESLDTFYYIRGISHQFTFGGSFRTTLSLIAGRRKHLVPPSDTNPKGAGFERDNFGFVKGVPNAILEFDGVVDENGEVVVGDRVEDAAGSPQAFNLDLQQNSVQRAIQLQQDAITNRIVNGLLLGRWTETTVDEFLKRNKKDEDTTREGDKNARRFIFTTSAVLPISDENGYELIGLFPYGRTLNINPDVGFSRPLEVSLGKLSPRAVDPKTLDIARLAQGAISDAFSALTGGTQAVPKENLVKIFGEDQKKLVQELPIQDESTTCKCDVPLEVEKGLQAADLQAQNNISPDTAEFNKNLQEEGKRMGQNGSARGQTQR